MGDNQLSELAKAILANEPITPSTGVSEKSGSVAPQGSIFTMDGAKIVRNSEIARPSGSIPVNFSKDESEKDLSNKNEEK